MEGYKAIHTWPGSNWSPDGLQVAYLAEKEETGATELLVFKAGEAPKCIPLPKENYSNMPIRWSSNEKILIMAQQIVFMGEEIQAIEVILGRQSETHLIKCPEDQEVWYSERPITFCTDNQSWFLNGTGLDKKDPWDGGVWQIYLHTTDQKVCIQLTNLPGGCWGPIFIPASSNEQTKE